MTSPYDNKTSTGVNIDPHASGTTTQVWTNATFVGGSLTAPDFPVVCQSCNFQNFQFLQPRPGSQFFNCTWSGSNGFISLGWTYNVLFVNPTFNQTTRGIQVQLRPGWTCGGLRVYNMVLNQVGGNPGQQEWFLAEGPGGVLQDAVIDGVTLNMCPGKFTVSNCAVVPAANGNGLTVTNVRGISNGVWCYGTPTNGSQAAITFSNWAHTGGRFQLDIATASAFTGFNLLSPNTNTGDPPGSAAFTALATNAGVTLTNSLVLNRPPSMPLTYGVVADGTVVQ